jgi:hypothetical protein
LKGTGNASNNPGSSGAVRSTVVVSGFMVDFPIDPAEVADDSRSALSISTTTSIRPSADQRSAPSRRFRPVVGAAAPQVR